MPRKRGGKIATGGRIDPNSENFIFPTIIINCNTSMKLFSEEVFGPLLPIFIFNNIDEVISLINSGDYGLGASIWSKDIEHSKEIAKRLDVGMVWINDANLPFPQAPWAGRKDSGPGIELSVSGLRKFVREKHICIDNDASPKRDWWFPY